MVAWEGARGGMELERAKKKKKGPEEGDDPPFCHAQAACRDGMAAFVRRRTVEGGAGEGSTAIIR